jgi:hypothetical protein
MSKHRDPAWRRAAGMGALLALLGCGNSRSQPPDPELHLTDLSIDALAAPRDDNPLIAGEEVRIGLRVRGGSPPYRGTITAVRQGTPLPDSAANPISASFDPDPEKHISAALEMALRARLQTLAPSGVYRLRATVTDARDRSAAIMSEDWTLIGDDATTLPATSAPPLVEVVDVAGRRRESFVRGEAITIRATLPGQRAAEIALHGPDGVELARTRQPLSAAGELSVSIPVPRLARSGAHGLGVTADDGTELWQTIMIAGPPFAPAGKLVVDDLALYGGEDLRAPRAGVLERGELLSAEARVGGGRVAVTGKLGLHTIAGEVVDQVDLGRAEIAHPGPGGRVYIQGQWRVPPAIAPGRYQLQVTVLEGNDVSVRYREVLIR